MASEKQFENKIKRYLKERGCYRVKYFRHLQPSASNQPSNVLPVLNDGAPRTYRKASQSFLSLSLEKHFSRLGMNLLQS